MLSFLLDEQVSYVVAEQMRAHRSEIEIYSIHDWQDGAFLGIADEALLLAAEQEQLTLVTYDQKTIPPLLLRWGAARTEHQGVIFCDNFTIAQSDIGGLVRALIAKWDTSKEWDWTNRIDYLRPAK